MSFRSGLDVAACMAALFEVALVVFFGAPEGLGRFYLGDDALGFESAFQGELFDPGVGLGFLLRRMEKDGGAILCAPIRTLAVESGWVVEGEEGVEELIEGDARRVEVEFDDFRVAGGVRADVFVGRPVQLAAFIADSGGCDAGNCGKSGFHTPETASPEGCFFNAHD